MDNYHYFYDGLLLAQPFDFRRKKQALQLKVNHMLNRLSSMFKWEGLPDSIPQRMLELYLMSSGACAVTKVGEKLYAFTGGLGGEPDEYYRPTIFTIANPYLKFNEMLRIDEECALVLNDTCHAGLLGLLEQYGTAMVENELSMQVATINSRVMSIITAEDDNAKASADKFLSPVSSQRSELRSSLRVSRHSLTRSGARPLSLISSNMSSISRRACSMSSDSMPITT